MDCNPSSSKRAKGNDGRCMPNNSGGRMFQSRRVEIGRSTKDSNDRLVQEIEELSIMIDGLLKEVRRNSMNYPNNKETETMLFSTFKHIKQGIRFSRKLINTAPMCPELKPRKRGITRRHYTFEEKGVLFKYFRIYGTSITQEIIQNITKEIDVSPERIKKWFSNQFQQERKDHLLADQSPVEVAESPESSRVQSPESSSTSESRWK